MPNPETESATTTDTQAIRSANTIAMLEMLRQARALLDGCYYLLFADMERVPDDLLREATDDIFEIREIADEIYDPIAFQLAVNEVAALEAEDATGTMSAESNSLPQAMAIDVPATGRQGEPALCVPTTAASLAAGSAGEHDARGHAEGLLEKAYATIIRRILNRGREQLADAEYRDRLLADFRVRVAALSEEDRICLGNQEAGYLDRAAKLQKQVNAMLTFWDQPEISSSTIDS